jgi:CheY-like chemotaxis protein
LVRRFSGQIAHELNNALTGILGLAEILQRRTDLSADVRAQIDSIARHGGRLKRLGQQLIEISRTSGADAAEPLLQKWLEGAQRATSPEARPVGETLRTKISGSVLLVEDEEVVRAVLSWQLRDMGLAVECSASAEEAEVLLSRGAGFDLAIVDHVLPGMTGLEFATRLHEVRPTLPVLMLSGRTEVPAPAAGVFQAWLVKPVDPDDLRRAVADQLAAPG